jgi:hypothetical protein
MTFTLKIELGNTAMQTGADVAEAVRGVADRLDGLYGYHRLEECAKDGYKVRDINGNTVGEWEIS